MQVLHTSLPDLLYDMLIASPKMSYFICEKPLLNNHLKLIADSCPNLSHLKLSSKLNLDPEVGKLEFDDVGLHVVADACIHLVYVNLSGRIYFKEIRIGSLVRSCKLRSLILKDCVNVTVTFLKIIADATCLKVLCLKGCYLISDLGLEHLANGVVKPSLDTLELGGCNRITDYGIVSLCELPSIKSLDLDDLFNITDISLLTIGRKYPNIESISLNGCKRITGVGLRAFSGHQRLYQLGLFSCYKVSLEDVQSIALTLPSLLTVRLSRSMKEPMPDAGYEDFFITGNHYRTEWK